MKMIQNVSATAGQRKFQHLPKIRSNLTWYPEHVVTKYLPARSRAKRNRAVTRDDRRATEVK